MLFVNTDDSILGELSQEASANNKNLTKEQLMKNLFSTSHQPLAMSQEIPILLEKKKKQFDQKPWQTSSVMKT